MGTIIVIVRIHDEQRITAEQDAFIFRGQSRFHIALALERMRICKQDEQNNRHRETIGQAVRRSIAYNDFGCHISGFSRNAGNIAIRCYIIIITDQHLACIGINKEVAIVQILIAVACIMQNTVCRNNPQCGIYYSAERLKAYIAQHKLGNLMVATGA